MAEQYQPFDPDYRRWATGSVLLEIHAATGAWPEFLQALQASPELAQDVLAWICPEDDWQYASIREAQRIAREIALERS
jgi:hypothetical protein